MLFSRQETLQTHLVAVQMHKTHSDVKGSTQIRDDPWHHSAVQATHVLLGTYKATHPLVSSSTLKQ